MKFIFAESRMDEFKLKLLLTLELQFNTFQAFFIINIHK